MTRQKPWMKFYPADWRSDPALRMCSLAARGLWIEMMALMHEAEPYGYLLVKGKQPNMDKLAALVGVNPTLIPELIQELEEAEVFSRTSEGVIYSRRMLKDAARSQKARESGQQGGNPSLRNRRNNQGSDKGSDNPADNPDDKPQDNGADNGRDKATRARVPEARGQSHNSPPPVTAAAREGGRDGDGEVQRVCQAIQRVVNAGHPLPDLARYVKRWRDHGLDLDADVLETIKAETDRKRRSDGEVPGHPKYFDKAVFRAHRERTAPPPADDRGQRSNGSTGGEGRPLSPEEHARRQARIYLERGIWPFNTLPPPDPTSGVSQKVLDEQRAKLVQEGKLEPAASGAESKQQQARAGADGG